MSNETINIKKTPQSITKLEFISCKSYWGNNELHTEKLFSKDSSIVLIQSYAYNGCIEDVIYYTNGYGHYVHFFQNKVNSEGNCTVVWDKIKKTPLYMKKGQSIFYDSIGRVRTIGNIDNYIHIGDWFNYDEKGNLISIDRYEKGLIVNTFILRKTKSPTYIKFKER